MNKIIIIYIIKNQLNTLYNTDQLPTLSKYQNFPRGSLALHFQEKKRGREERRRKMELTEHVVNIMLSFLNSNEISLYVINLLFLIYVLFVYCFVNDWNIAGVQKYAKDGER